MVLVAPYLSLEDVALTDLDKDTSDEDRVALMTIHLAKGLVSSCFVGMEEDCFQVR
jgi:DNA helicase-2/ATP-dependent DNA helicase PcrA